MDGLRRRWSVPVHAQVGSGDDVLGLACEAGSEQARKGGDGGRVRLRRLQRAMVMRAGDCTRGDSRSCSDGATAAAADGPWPLPRTGLRRHGEKLCPCWADDGDASGSRFFLEASMERSSPLYVASWAKTFWLGDAGAGGIAFL